MKFSQVPDTKTSFFILNEANITEDSTYRDFMGWLIRRRPEHDMKNAFYKIDYHQSININYDYIITFEQEQDALEFKLLFV